MTVRSLVGLVLVAAVSGCLPPMGEARVVATMSLGGEPLPEFRFDGGRAWWVGLDAERERRVQAMSNDGTVTSYGPVLPPGGRVLDVNDTYVLLETDGALLRLALDGSNNARSSIGEWAAAGAVLRADGSVYAWSGRVVFDVDFTTGTYRSMVAYDGLAAAVANVHETPAGTFVLAGESARKTLYRLGEAGATTELATLDIASSRTGLLLVSQDETLVYIDPAGGLNRFSFETATVEQLGGTESPDFLAAHDGFIYASRRFIPFSCAKFDCTAERAGKGWRSIEGSATVSDDAVPQGEWLLAIGADANGVWSASYDVESPDAPISVVFAPHLAQ